MARRLSNLVVLLSLLLSMAAAFMWLRSGHLGVIEAWQFAPEPSSGPSFPEMRGWWRSHRLVESSSGRLVFVKYDAFLRAPMPTDPPIPPPIVAYHQFARPYAPETYSRDHFSFWWQRPPAPQGAVYGRVLGVEWYWVPQRYNPSRRYDPPRRHPAPWYHPSPRQYDPPQRYVAVSWLVLALAGAVLPAVRVGRRRLRRWRQSRTPAFPIVLSPASEVAAAAGKPAGQPEPPRKPHAVPASGPEGAGPLFRFEVNR